MGNRLLLHKAKQAFNALIDQHRLAADRVRVTVEPLSPREAIGRVQREDFPLLEGKEVMIEAEFRGSFGQAFTDQPRSFRGTIKGVQSLNLNSSANRAVFVSTINAVTAYLGIVDRTQHCKDDEPERCGSEIARELLEEFGKIKVGLVGYQPAILENLSHAFGAANVRCSDLGAKNIGSDKFGPRVWDGKTETNRLIDWCDVLLVTGSAIVNGTFDDIYLRAEKLPRKSLFVFGVTGAGVAVLLGLRRICHYGH